MNTPFVLTPDIKVINLRAKDTFQHLELTNARFVQGQSHPEFTPYIEFTLLGDGIKFTAYANLIPDANELNCFDLLEAAKQAMGTQKQLFERVEIRAVDEQYVVAYRIEGELESEDDKDKINIR